MSSSASIPTSYPQPAFAAATGSLSTEAEIGLVVCSVLFIFILVAFCIVSRKRQLWCFRRDDLETQSQVSEDIVHKSTHPASQVNASGQERQRLTEHERKMLRREQGALFGSAEAAVLDDNRARHSWIPTMPRLAYEPSQKAFA